MTLGADRQEGVNEMAAAEQTYLPYIPSVEEPAEAVIFDEIWRTLQHITRRMAARYRQAYRPVHAKSHGVLVGTMGVLPGLAEPLAQDLFRTKGS